MSDLYIDLDADFVAGQSGADHTGNELKGVGGMYAACTGLGGGPTFGDDTIYVKGTAHLYRFVQLDVNGHDCSGWTIGATVVPHTDPGDWSGKVVRVNIGAADIIIIQLDSGYNVLDITAANGINNTTDADDVDTTLAGIACNGFDWCGADGTASHAQKWVGVNDSWVEDNTQAVIDGDGEATYCWYTTTAMYFWHMRNFSFINAVSEGMHVTEYSYYCTFVNAAWDNNGSHGCSSGSKIGRSRFIHCQATGNSGRGMEACYGCHAFCSYSDNSSRGGSSLGTVYRGLIADNGSYGEYTGTANVQIGCVYDSNKGTGGAGVVHQSYGNIVLCSRLTNHSEAGAYAVLTSYGAGVAAYCYLHNNTNDYHSAIWTYGCAEDTDTDDGLDANYNVEAGKVYRSEEIPIGCLV